MMSSFRRLFVLALVFMLTVLPAAAQESTAWIRFVHAIPGAAAIDVYTDGSLTAHALSYGSATDYISVPSGAHHIIVTQSGSTDALWEQDIEPAAGTATVLVASSASQAAFQAFQDDLNPLPLGKARFTAIHAIADAAPVDIILADGRPVIPGLQYNQPYGTLDLPVTTYELAVVPSGQPISAALVDAQPYDLATGTSYIVLVYGTPTDAEVLLLAAPTRTQGEAGYVRIAHTLPEGAVVDIFINNTIAVPSLAFGESSEFIALAPGSYNLAAHVGGETRDLATGTVEVEAGTWQTALVATNGGEPSIMPFSDQIGAVNATASVLSILNASADATVTATSDGTEIIGNVETWSAASAMLEPSEEIVAINDEPLDAPGGIYGGVYYSAVVVGDGEVVQLPAVSIAQGIASAPGAQPVATPTLAPSPTPTEAPTDLPTPTPAATEAPVNLPTPTQAQQVEQPTQPPPVAPTAASPTARVLVNEGVNLQLRQYPDRVAFSLGLAPANATLIVHGRAGAPVPPIGTTATPMPEDATPFVDPVALLAGDEDLDPTQTWVNITYNTPDGGSITAWVNAFYITITDPRGRLMRLRDLPTVPSNQAGVARDTAIQPPTATEILTYAIVVGADPGVNVHIRRIPSTEGESLALLPNGTQVVFAGVNEARDWTFVRFTDTTGSTITGWVDTRFLTLQRLDQPIDYARLQELNALPVIDAAQRGEVITTGQPTAAAVATDLRNVVAGTVVGLNPGANVHMRRQPNEQAESLALLPSGATVLVMGRTNDNTWLQVSYQNQTGWISAPFLNLTFNGQAYELATLPDVSTPTPSPTPTATETPAA